MRDTCGRSDRGWTSTAQCHSPGCCRHFSSMTANDMHQVAGQVADLVSRQRQAQQHQCPRPCDDVTQLPTEP